MQRRARKPCGSTLPNKRRGREQYILGQYDTVQSTTSLAVLVLFLTMDMPYTQAQTCFPVVTTNTIPMEGSRARVNGGTGCPSFTPATEGLLHHMTVVATGSLNSAHAFGSMGGGSQFRNSVNIASPSSPATNLWDTSYTTRTRAIGLYLLQGDVFSGAAVTVNVSFMYTYIPDI